MTRTRRAGINPAVDDGFISALKVGRARVVGEVQRLEREGAVLVDGVELPVDSVVCATGYRRGLEGLVGHLNVLDHRGAPTYSDGAPSTRRRPACISPDSASLSAGRYESRASTRAESPGL